MDCSITLCRCLSAKVHHRDSLKSCFQKKQWVVAHLNSCGLSQTHPEAKEAISTFLLFRERLYDKKEALCKRMCVKTTIRNCVEVSIPGDLGKAPREGKQRQNLIFLCISEC